MLNKATVFVLHLFADGIEIVFEGPVDRTGKKTETELNWTVGCG
jgi:hypothetical protein